MVRKALRQSKLSRRHLHVLHHGQRWCGRHSGMRPSHPHPAPLPLLVALPRDHRLAGRGRVPPSELRDERWVAGSDDPRSTLLGPWAGSAWEPDLSLVARDWMAKIGLVAAGLGVTVVPGIAVPAGKDSQGLPLGLQLIGRPFDEETLFSLGEVIEQAAGRFTAPKWW